MVRETRSAARRRADTRTDVGAREVVVRRSPQSELAETDRARNRRGLDFTRADRRLLVAGL